MKKIILLLSILVFPSVGLAAAPGSAGELLPLCETSVNGRGAFDKAVKENDVDGIGGYLYAMGNCIGVVGAVGETIESYEDILRLALPKGRLVCMPEGVITKGQMIKIFIKYANEHPESLHERGALIVFRSLANAFPCP